ncbi:MAG: hypothetical protein QG608_91 [Actinomycetota bacterium]|nr:hypothetical protein [Actinomycetota bacterium]
MGHGDPGRITRDAGITTGANTVSSDGTVSLDSTVPSDNTVRSGNTVPSARPLHRAERRRSVARVLAGRVALLCLPLLLMGGADAGAFTDPEGNGQGNRSTVIGPDGRRIPEDDLEAGTPVLPENGDLDLLVLAGDPAAGEDAATGGLTATGIPIRALSSYVDAAKTLASQDPGCSVHWSLLAAIGRVESDHGRHGGATIGDDGKIAPPIIGPRLDGSSGTAKIKDSDGGRYDGDTEFDRAVGPMQFIPGTWQQFEADADGDGLADPQDLDDAALTTARYLCDGDSVLSTEQGRWNAVFRYNHSREYVALVLGLANSYRSGTAESLPTEPPGSGQSTTRPPASVTGPSGIAGNSPGSGGTGSSSGGRTPVVPPQPTPAPAPTRTTEIPVRPGPTTSRPKPKPTTSKPSRTQTPRPTSSGLHPSRTPTKTLVPSPTGSASPSPTDTPTPSPTGSVSPSPTGSASPSPTGSASPSPTDTPTPFPTGSPSPEAEKICEGVLPEEESHTPARPTGQLPAGSPAAQEELLEFCRALAMAQPDPESFPTASRVLVAR